MKLDTPAELRVLAGSLEAQSIPGAVICTVAASEIERVGKERDSERDARERADRALREKDRAMSVMFKRLDKAGVDYSDLIP